MILRGLAFVLYPGQLQLQVGQLMGIRLARVRQLITHRTKLGNGLHMFFAQTVELGLQGITFAKRLVSDCLERISPGHYCSTSLCCYLRLYLRLLYSNHATAGTHGTPAGIVPRPGRQVYPTKVVEIMK